MNMAFCTSLMMCTSFPFLKNKSGKICAQGAFKRPYALNYGGSGLD